MSAAESTVGSFERTAVGNTFITENFLLSCDQAIALYHDYARDLPIIDYHCHLPPQQIAEDTKFDNLTQAWLYGDHYKWRAMRAAGVPEEFCTGDATDWDKFQKWAETVPKTLRRNAPRATAGTGPPRTRCVRRFAGGVSPGGAPRPDPRSRGSTRKSRPDPTR